MNAKSYYLIQNGKHRLLTDCATTAEAYAQECNVRAMTVKA